MSTSFGNNKRKPGATAGAVTEAKRRATLAANWEDYSKQPKVPGASIVPSIMGRNAGIQSIFNAQNNGSNPIPPIPSSAYIPGLKFAGFEWSFYSSGNTSVPTILDILSWGQQHNSILSEIDSVVNSTYLNDGKIIKYITPPAARINTAVYMTGYYQAPISGNYVFGFKSDDGFQLIFNNILPPIINSPVIQSGSVEINNNLSPIALIAGVYYPISMLWSNNNGGSFLNLTRITVNGTNIFLNNPPSPLVTTYLPTFYIDNDGLPIILPGSTQIGALEFNPPAGQTSYILTPYSTNISSSGYTFEWFQKMISVPTSGADFPRPFAIGEGANGPLSLSIEVAGSNVLFKVFGGGTLRLQYIIPNPIELSSWAHIAIVFYTGGTLSLFFNGNRVATASGVPVSGSIGGTDIVLGNWDTSPNTNAQFNGYITNFRFTNSSVYPNNITLSVPTIPLKILTNTVLMLNVPNDTNKYRNCTLVNYAATPSPSNPPTFQAFSDPL